MTQDRADAWRAEGEYFSWQPSDGGAPAVNVFHIEMGARDAPVLVLVHGFPTSSIDWFEVAERLRTRFRVCALDFPGYGFSDKPRNWGCSLTRDAELLAHYIDEVLGADSVVMVAHDRGDSVALIHAAGAGAAASRARLDHLVLSNANIFLPMSNLTTFQRLVLDPATAPEILEVTTPQRLAEGLGANTFTPPRDASDPEIKALAACFAHDDGVAVLHEMIQYLVERSANEEEWLAALAASDVPTTIIWGLHDTVSPPRVVMWVWLQFLMGKRGANALYFVEGANHYLQNDQPDAFVDALSHALDPDAARTPGAISAEPGAPVLVDCSRARVPTASEVLRGDPEAAT
jgi:pimeloyl-ACP methyl ester carboxylesterase